MYVVMLFRRRTMTHCSIHKAIEFIEIFSVWFFVWFVYYVDAIVRVGIVIHMGWRRFSCATSALATPLEWILIFCRRIEPFILTWAEFRAYKEKGRKGTIFVCYCTIKHLYATLMRCEPLSYIKWKKCTAKTPMKSSHQPNNLICIPQIWLLLLRFLFLFILFRSHMMHQKKVNVFALVLTLFGGVC